MNTKIATNVIVIAAGGSGGHIYPGIALAEAIHMKDMTVHWIGSTQGMEQNIITHHANINLHTFSMPRIRGKGLFRWLLMPYLVSYYIFLSYRLLQKLRATCVVCMGGFVTVPVGLAAWCLSIPLLVHEQNAVAGLSNRVLARFAHKVFSGFATTKYLSAATYIGNPVRSQIQNVMPPKKRFALRGDEKIRIAILGGSQGADALNIALPPLLIASNLSVSIWHQHGKQRVPNYDNASAIEVRIDAFIENMSELYQWADIVITRAGAMTVSEIMVVGLGAIFIPFPTAVDNHQNYNADLLVAHGAAYKVQQQEMAHTLPNILQQLLSNTKKASRQRLLEMALAAKQVANNNAGSAGAQLANACFEYTHR